MLPYLRQLRRTLRSDALAGFTVAMVGTPQCMAYAAIAGIAPIYGLYTGIVPTIVSSLFGASSYLISGPSNATSLVTANVLRSYASTAPYIELVFALAVLSGLIKLTLGLLNLGWIIRYVSPSVLMGFLVGASTLIVLGQLNNALGLPSTIGAATPEIIRSLAAGLPKANLHAAVCAAATMLLLVAIKSANRLLPAELLSIAVVALFAYVAGWSDHDLRLVRDLGSLQDMSLRVHIPDIPLKDWAALLPNAGAVALFSLVEGMSIAQAVGGAAGERVKPTREFIGQGMASLVGGFFQSIPASGSPSRTAVNFSSGAKTRLAGVLSGLTVLLGLVVLAPLLDRIPVASLAGVIIVTAYNLVDRRQLRIVWRSQPSSRVVLVATLLAALLLPMHIAIYLGALLSIAFYVYESSKLQLSYLSRNVVGSFVEHSLEELVQNPPAIAIINVEGTLSFGAADDLEHRVATVIHSGVRVVILRLRRLRLLGSTDVAALEHIITTANRSGTRVLLCGVRDDVDAALHSSGVEGVLGPHGIFKASDVLFASTQHALARAEEIILAERTHGD